MPFGYLIATGLIAACVLFALAPLRPRRSSRFRVSFFLAFAVNELPFFAFYWLLASTLLAVEQGDISNPVGWIGLGLAVLATLGLVLVALRALPTGDAVDRALTDAGLPPRSRRRTRWLRILAWPFGFPNPGIRRIANIPYGEAGRANLLDVYRGRSPSRPGLTLVHLHGGGFVMGSKSREARPLFDRLARRGWVCISPNYRLRTRYAEQLEDVKEVLTWVREHGSEYGADPSVVFVAGSSAGAHLASMAALTTADPSLRGVIGLYGYYGPVGTERSTPLAYEGDGAPPFFVVHPARDTLVVPEDARRFAESLRKRSTQPVVYAELPGAQHGFDFFYSIRFEAVIDGIEAFAASAAEHHLPGRGGLEVG